jgi:SAM-dependent methyltransferase
MHVDQIRKYGSVGIEHAKFYEFGAGWDLIGPLAFYIMGARDQTLSDIAPNLKLSLINHSLARFHRLADEIREITGATTIPLPPSITSEVEIRPLGMEYIVADLEELSLAPAQFDYITSTCVLEHVPAGEIPPMLRKCYELLKPGGFLCSVVDLQDHYSYFDSSVSVLNFLKYSDFTWDLLFNSPLHHLNRLRFTDHLRMIREANFEIVTYWTKDTPLNVARINPTLRARYDDKALGACTLWVVGRVV